MVPDACVEFRTWGATFNYKTNRIDRAEKWPRVLGGWFDKSDHLIFECKRLNGISGYVTVNPLIRSS